MGHHYAHDVEVLYKHTMINTPGILFGTFRTHAHTHNENRGYVEML
jgi:hypothetical protein